MPPPPPYKMQKSKIKNQKFKSKIKNFEFCIVILIFTFCILNFIGCATVPTQEALPTYSINGINYVPLVALCESRGIALEYDTFTRSAILRKDAHKINLIVGETLALVDERSMHLRHPVELYQGAVVVPYRFKEEVLDALFKEGRPSVKVSAPLYIKKVVIDAGHGGNDPGAIGRTGLREKDVTLDISRRLSNLLRQKGIEVVMTRTIDRFIPLELRVSIANNSKADLFLSIHANANRVRSLNGFEVYYVDNSVNDNNRALWAAQNARLDFDSSCFATNSPTLKAILWDMLYTQARAESIELARSICASVGRNLDTKVLRIKGGRFYVLKGVGMSAILIETGFLSNYSEERMLKNNFYRENLAESIAEGINNYSQEFALREAR